MSAENWSVYLILCENGALYCGISNRPQERFVAHLAGKGAKYMRLNKPTAMRIVSDDLSKSEALKREIAIKTDGREEAGIVGSGGGKYFPCPIAWIFPAVV